MAAENVSFRAWLKFRSGFSDGEVDALVRQTADEVWARIDCLACGACCRALSIVLDDRDIVRLSRRLGLSAADFTRRYVQRDGPERRLAAQPCLFLDGNACKVYEDRPTACRDFPYLHAEGFRDRMLGLIEYSLLCPVVLNALEVLKRRLPWRKKRRKPQP